MTLGAGSRSCSVRSVALAAAAVAAIGCGAETAQRPSPTPAPSAAPTPTPSAVPTPTPAPAVEQLDDEAVMDHIRALAVEIGLRNAGGDGDEKASHYIAERISKLGWTAERRPFPLPQGGRSWNVVGVPPGFDEAKPYVIVGGHYDSINGPGANDNATGIAVALDIARVVDANPGSAPVLFVAFGAEERQPTPERDHHVGSQHYVAKMPAAARKNLIAFVNIDMVGHGSPIQCGRMSTGPREGTDRCLRLGRELGIPVKERVTPDWSDNGSFLREGLNAAWLWTGDVPCCYHNPKDTIDIVRPDDLRRSGRLALAIVRSYSR